MAMPSDLPVGAVVFILDPPGLYPRSEIMLFGSSYQGTSSRILSAYFYYSE